MHSGTRTLLVLLAMASTAPAAGQTVITLDNLAALAGGGTVLDLNNSSVALSNGGFRAGAVSLLGQSANNQLNVLDLLSTPAGTSVASTSPLAGQIQITMRAAAVPTSVTSLTTVNTSGAIAGGINPIVGATVLNTPWTGGYGGASGAALVGGAQSGLNAINGVAVAVAPGATVSLVQQTGPLALLPLAQASMLNAAVTNTLVSSGLNGGASINGAAGAAALGQQGAGIAVNGALVSGGGIVDVQQIGGMAATALQTVNRAGAFTNMALVPSFNIR